MADEITAKVYLDVNKTGVPQVTKAPGQISITMTGTNLILATQEIGTSAEAIVLGEVGTPGMCLLHNSDDTNFVEIGHDNGGFETDIKMLAGEWALFRMNNAAPQAKADTAAVVLEYFIIEA